MYSVYCLLLLPDDAKHLRCLDDFRAFVFENKLGQLKKFIHKSQQPFQQVLRRLGELQSFGTQTNAQF